jgi:hypothetical protein
MSRSPIPIFAIQALFVILVLVVACQPGANVTPTQPPTQAAGPRLRITNNSSETIQGLVVIFPDQRIEFGDVPGGATTQYMPAPKGVYNYAAYEYTLNGEKVTQPVIDWVGESAKTQGSFTYVLAFNPTQPNMLRIELVETIIE